jgi:hypothetical protein
LPACSRLRKSRLPVPASSPTGTQARPPPWRGPIPSTRMIYSVVRILERGLAQRFNRSAATFVACGVEAELMEQVEDRLRNGRFFELGRSPAARDARLVTGAQSWPRWLPRWCETSATAHVEPEHMRLFAVLRRPRPQPRRRLVHQSTCVGSENILGIAWLCLLGRVSWGIGS